MALAYAYTDHFCQGSSFPLGEPWLVHLTPPSDGGTDFDGKGILVTSTRNGAWGDEQQLATLYTTDAERTSTIARFEAAFRRTDDEEAEMERLADLARHTKDADWDRLAGKFKLIPDGWSKPLTGDELTAMELPPPADIRAEAAAYEIDKGFWDGMDE